MLANLLDIDEAMLLGALRGDGSMAFFFDFAAAFASIEHDFLTEFFKSLGWPKWLLNMVNRLYSRNFCQMVMGGSASLVATSRVELGRVARYPRYYLRSRPTFSFAAWASYSLHRLGGLGRMTWRWLWIGFC